MPRTMTVAIEKALSARVVRCALLAQLELANESLYLWTGIGPMTWNSLTFTGIGSLGKISPISEGSTVEARGITLTLDGLSANNIDEILNDVRILGDAQVWLALYDENFSLIPDPILSFKGLLDRPSLTDGGSTCSCAITAENVLVDLNRACYRRFTADDQQLDLADTLKTLGLPASTVDTGFRFVPGVQERITFWGVTPSSSNNV